MKSILILQNSVSLIKRDSRADFRHWRYFWADILKKGHFVCLSPKQMSFLTISNGNIFFENGTRLRAIVALNKDLEWVLTSL